MSKFSVLLISANIERDPCPVFPIGLAYIGGALERAGYQVHACDLCFAADPQQTLTEMIGRSDPDLIGLSIRNIDNVTYGHSIFYLPYLQKITHTLRQLTSAPLILGGSGFSLFAQPLLRVLEADGGIVGEGEHSFVRLAQRIQQGKDYVDIPGVAVIRHGHYHLTAWQHIASLPAAPPARHLFDLAHYIQAGAMANIQSKRGCTCQCIYCTYPYLEGQRVRTVAPQQVVAEMLELFQQHQERCFTFVDNIFNVPLSHAREICQLLCAHRFRWTAFFNPGAVDADFLELARQAGCMGIEFGTEALDAAQLLRLGKGFTPQQVLAAGKAARQVDLPAVHYLLLGGPGETPASLERTLRALEKLESQAVICMLGIRISPHTPLARLAVEQGLIEAQDDLLTPKFYISPLLDPQWMCARIQAYAQRPNWIVPGLGINASPALLQRIRRLKIRRPLWTLLQFQASATLAANPGDGGKTRTLR